MGQQHLVGSTGSEHGAGAVLPHGRAAGRQAFIVALIWKLGGTLILCLGQKGRRGHSVCTCSLILPSVQHKDRNTRPPAVGRVPASKALSPLAQRAQHSQPSPETPWQQGSKPPLTTGRRQLLLLPQDALPFPVESRRDSPGKSLEGPICCRVLSMIRRPRRREERNAASLSWITFIICRKRRSRFSHLPCGRAPPLSSAQPPELSPPHGWGREEWVPKEGPCICYHCAPPIPQLWAHDLLQGNSYLGQLPVERNQRSG